MNINIIVAVCRNGGIGYKNSLPFHFKKDLKYFSKITKGVTIDKQNEVCDNNAVLMGRNTWESLPKKPLPGRVNYVISQTMFGQNIFNSIDGCLEVCREKEINNVWVIGGTSIYNTFILNKDYKYLVDKIYVTKIHEDYICDTFFPMYEVENSGLWRFKEGVTDYENGTQLDFCVFERA